MLHPKSQAVEVPSQKSGRSLQLLLKVTLFLHRVLHLLAIFIVSAFNRNENYQMKYQTRRNSCILSKHTIQLIILI